MILLIRLPKKENIVQVYAVIVVLFYSWTIITSFKDLSTNWLLYFNIADMVSLFAYSLIGAFLESLVSIFALLLIGFILPFRRFNENFVLYGSILSFALAGSLIHLYSQTLTFGILDKVGIWAAVFLGTVIALMSLGKIFPVIGRIVQSIAERLVVFLYIYLPLTAISILIVLVRNINP